MGVRAAAAYCINTTFKEGQEYAIYIQGDVVVPRHFYEGFFSALVLRHGKGALNQYTIQNSPQMSLKTYLRASVEFTEAIAHIESL